MNKNVIVTYEKEFMAWCKGTPVLMGFPASMQDASINKLSWRSVTDFKDWSALDAKYIINDDYSHLRKALCNGKTIQVWDIISQHSTNPLQDIYDWRDFKSFKPDSPFTYTVDKYRIKSEEPQFKIDDFIRNTSSNTVEPFLNSKPSWFKD